MALQELTNESPTFGYARGSKTETRIFLSNNIPGDLPAIGSSSSGVHSSFVNDWTVTEAQATSKGTKDTSANAQFKVTITTAINATAIDPSPDEDPEVPRYSFNIVEEIIQNAAGTESYLGVSMIYVTKREYSTSSLLTVLNAILGSLGLSNAAANSPYIGATVDEWRLMAAPMEWISGSRFRVEWTYQHAGRTSAGASQTWTTKTTYETGFTQVKGSISPL